MSKSPENHAIESLEPLLLMSASAADADPNTLGDGNDVLIALNSGQLMDGDDGNDILIGLAGDNVMKGGDGHDMLIAIRGDNVIDGGSGQDTLVYWNGNRADYNIVDKGFGIIEISNEHCTDFVTNVESVQFQDGTYSIDELLNGGPSEPPITDPEPETEDVPNKQDEGLIWGTTPPTDPEPETEDVPNKQDEDLIWGTKPATDLDPAIVNSDGDNENSDPIARKDKFYTDFGSTVVGNVLVNDSDPDDDELFATLKIGSGPKNGTLTLNEDGSFQYTPNDGFSGHDSFSYIVADENDGMAMSKVCIFVSPETDSEPEADPEPDDKNSDPIARKDKFYTDFESTVLGNVLDNDSDPDGDDLFATLKIGSGPKNGTLTLNEDGSFQYTPNDGFSGHDSFSYIVADENDGMAMSEVCIFVSPETTKATASLGDRVWLDSNGNGLQDDGEPGVADVTVHLKDGNGNVIATQQTDASGNYLFDNLQAGDYSVGVIAPEGFELTTQDVLGNRADAADSDVNPTTAMTQTITLSEGEQNRTLDAGLVELPPPATASLGDRVWLDSNGNGLQDDGEPGVADVTVHLKDGNGNVIATQQTDASGNYLFDNLQAGDYSVGVIAPEGFELTTQDVLGNRADAADSDVNPTTAMTQTITLSEGEQNRTLDAGLVELPPPATASLGDRVWLDSNGNGLQDDGEPGVADVTVQLKDGNGNVIATQQTDASGNYLFDNLQAGDYSVGVIAPEGFELTTQDALGNRADGADSDVNPATAMTQTITLSEGEQNRTLDAGLVELPPPATASLGDRVWLDSNGNGLQDDGEPGVADVTVHLKDGNGNVIATQQTDASGNYLFGDLQAGDYSVGVIAPEGFELTAQDVLGNRADATDSDVNPTTAMTQTITLSEGEQNRTLDAGLVELPPPATASLGDRVWLDSNGNGLQDDGEPGVADVTMQLKDRNGNVIATQQTDASGNYLFDNLQAGDYSVGVIAPEGFELTTQDVLGNRADATDSDVNPATAMTQTITLSEGEHNPTLDIGLVAPQPATASVGDRVWLDSNSNGVQDDGEQGVQGVTVQLKGVNGTVISSQETDSEGNYLFENLDPGGIYSIGIVTPEGFVLTKKDAITADGVDSDIDPTTQMSEDFTLAEGEQNLSIDAGLLEFVKPVDNCRNHRHTNVYGRTIHSFTITEDSVEDLADSYTFYKTDRSGNLIESFVVDNVQSLVLGGDRIDIPGVSGANVRLAGNADGTVSLRLAGGIVTTTTHVRAEKNGFFSELTHCPMTRTAANPAPSPIALDLSGDGEIGVTGETSSFEKDPNAEIGRTVKFDIDADGDLDTIEWYDGSGDGILIDDRDGNAATDMDGARLFGDQGGVYANGYEKLALLDANGDGMLNSAELVGLRVWVDDGDAVVEDGEIQSLSDHDIVGISTQMELVKDSDGRDLMQSSAITSDGQEILTEDVWFASK